MDIVRREDFSTHYRLGDTVLSQFNFNEDLYTQEEIVWLIENKLNTVENYKIIKKRVLYETLYSIFSDSCSYNHLKRIQRRIDPGIGLREREHIAFKKLTNYNDNFASLQWIKKSIQGALIERHGSSILDCIKNSELEHCTPFILTQRNELKEMVRMDLLRTYTIFDNLDAKEFPVVLVNTNLRFPKPILMYIEAFESLMDAIGIETDDDISNKVSKVKKFEDRLAKYNIIGKDVLKLRSIINVITSDKTFVDSEYSNTFAPAASRENYSRVFIDSTTGWMSVSTTGSRTP